MLLLTQNYPYGVGGSLNINHMLLLHYRMRIMAKKRQFFKDEVLSLLCEWDDCCQEFSNVDIFLNHIHAHIRDQPSGKKYCCVVVNQWIYCHVDLSFSDKLICMWEECDNKNSELEYDSRPELLRHAWFHGYHTKIKCIGSNMLKRNLNLDQCAFDSSSRNLIPDLPQSLDCGWQGCGVSRLSVLKMKVWWLIFEESFNFILFWLFYISGGVWQLRILLQACQHSCVTI